MAARLHHYVPRCYLKNFCLSKNGSSKLFVIDAIERKFFQTAVHNVAVERDFNTVEGENLAPDAVEKIYAEFEGELSPALERVIASRSLQNKSDREIVLNFIALLAARNPRLRKKMGSFQSEICKMMLQMATSTKERWESQVKQMLAAGALKKDMDISYENIKSFVTKGEFDIIMPTTMHVAQELDSTDHLVPYILGRKWSVSIAREDSGGFITSDHPVCLMWSEPRNGSNLFPPGFGLKGTDILFPVSPDLALQGRFEGEESISTSDVFATGMFNATMIYFSERQVYARDDKFAAFRCFPEPIRRGGQILDDPLFKRPRSEEE